MKARNFKKKKMGNVAGASRRKRDEIAELRADFAREAREKQQAVERDIEMGRALGAFQEATGLEAIPVAEIERCFLSAANGKPALDRAAFGAALHELQAHGLKPIAGTPLADRLFDVLDLDHSGSVDQSEFVAGCALLANGSVEQKAEITFRVYDADHSGYVDEAELVNMLVKSYEAAIRIAVASGNLDEANPLVHANIEQVRAMAPAMAKMMMENCDANSDGRLTLTEFKAFCKGSGVVQATICGFTGKVDIIAPTAK